MSRKAVVIVAAGKGCRMNVQHPKQFLELSGKPLLMHTIERFQHFDPSITIVVVLPFEHIDTWNRLCSLYRFFIPHQIVAGGPQRFHSVKNGLAALEADTHLVAVHDGVRPFVPYDLLKRLFHTAELYGSAVPVVTPGDSIRQVEKDRTIPVDRNQFRLVQTPQVFLYSKLFEAYQQPFRSRFTDDATVYEAAGNSIRLIDGSPVNIKITYPQDMILAESLFNVFSSGALT